MTPFLILTRAAIIGWTTLAVFPLEIAFDAIQGELERRDVELNTNQEAMLRLLAEAGPSGLSTSAECARPIERCNREPVGGWSGAGEESDV
jgi:hypothetical protein